LETHNLLPLRFVNASENRRAVEKNINPKAVPEKMKDCFAAQPLNDMKLPES